MVFTATGQTKTQNIGGVSAASISVTGSAFTTATWTLMGSNDGGVNWFPLNVAPLRCAPRASHHGHHNGIRPGALRCNLAGLTNIEIARVAHSRRVQRVSRSRLRRTQVCSREENEMRFAFHDATEGRPGTMFLMQPAQGKPRPLPADYPTGPEPFKTAADYVAQTKVLVAKTSRLS